MSTIITIIRYIPDGGGDNEPLDRYCSDLEITTVDSADYKDMEATDGEVVDIYAAFLLEARTTMKPNDITTLVNGKEVWLTELVARASKLADERYTQWLIDEDERMKAHRAEYLEKQRQLDLANLARLKAKYEP